MAERSRPGAEKRTPLAIKVAPALRSRLEDAAGEAGRTLSSEVERRLETSFATSAPDQEGALRDLDPAIASFLERSAERSGRSVMEEIEYHIERSNEYDQIVRRFFGGSVTHGMLMQVAQNLRTIEENFGDVKWYEAEDEIAEKMIRQAQVSIASQMTFSRMLRAPDAEGPPETSKRDQTRLLGQAEASKKFKAFRDRGGVD